MKNKFSWRAFISIALFYVIIILLVTGIVLYLAPSGRIAHWVNWKLIGLSKDQWQSVHVLFSFLFVILSVFHLFTVNWKAFWSYIKSKSQKGLNKKREFYISTGLTILIFVGVIYNVKPLSYVHEYGEYLTASWEEREENPPVPHAELFSITKLAEEEADLSVDRIFKILEENNITYINAEETLAEIGKANQLSPNKLYTIIISSKGNGVVGSSGGSGIGRLTIEEVSAELNLDVSDVLKLLEDKNIIAKKDQTLRDVALDNAIRPNDLYQLIKSE